MIYRMYPVTTDNHHNLNRGAVQFGIDTSVQVSRATLAIRTSNQTSQRQMSAPEPAADEAVSNRNIVERLVARESLALEELFDRMSGRAFGLAYRIIGDGPAAEDIVQDVFLWVWDNTDKLDSGRGSVDGLLLTLTHRRAVDAVRSRSRRAAISAEWLPTYFTTEVAELIDQVQSNMNAAAIRKVIESLPAEQHEVIELAYFCGMTHSEISAHTGFPLGTVKSRLRLAVNGIRKTLGITRTGGAS